MKRSLLYNMFLTVLLTMVSSTVSAQSVLNEVCPYHYSAADKLNLEKGIEAFDAHRYTEATTLIRKVSAKNPKAADPYFYLGMMAVKKNENPGAIRRYFTKLIDCCPDYPNALAHFYRGVIYYTDDQFEDCVAEMNRYFAIANKESVQEYLAVYEEASNYLYWAGFLNEAYQSPVPFNPLVVRGVSGKTDEILPYFTLDGKEVYYMRQVITTKERTVYAKADEKKEPRLCMSRRKDTAFTSGDALPFPFNQGDPEGGVSITADGNTLYLSSSKNGGSFDIYFTTKHDNQWGELQSAGRNVNDAKAWDSQPSISPDGRFLFFASNRAGGMGGSDIWYCYRLDNGDWSRAENMGPSINTSGNEKSPFICSDGHTLFFASDGWQGFGGYDMYRIDLSDHYRQRPLNLGHPINTEGDEQLFGVSANGKSCYFAGKNNEWKGMGGYDVFAFDLYPDARPESMRYVPVICPRSATVRLVRAGSDYNEYWIAEGKGGAMMLSCEENNIIIGMADGCIPHVLMVEKQRVSRLENIMLDLQPIKINAVCAIHAPLFNTQGHLSEQGKQVIDAYISFMLLKNPRMHIRIEAPVGSQAKEICDYMIEKQIRSERISSKVNTGCSGPQFVITQ